MGFTITEKIILNHLAKDSFANHEKKCGKDDKWDYGKDDNRNDGTDDKRNNEEKDDKDGENTELALKIDQTLTQDATGTMAYLQFLALGIDKVATKLSVSYVDHNTLQTGFENADDHLFLQSVAKKYRIVFSKSGNGICHQVHLERFAVPGETLLGSDSHTPTAGGIGMLAIGAGGLDVAAAMGGYPFNIVQPKILGVRLCGKLRPWVSAKDIILEILRRLSVKGGVGKILEYFGDGVQTLTVPERATITNMGAELGATTSIFPSDELTKEFLQSQHRLQDWKELKADPDAHYDEIIWIDLNQLEPLVAKPHSPDDVCKVKEIENIKVNQVCIGSCTNSSYRDLMIVAKALKNKQVHPEVSLTISPGSKQVYETIARNGALADLISSGARILECACGPCIGMGQSPPTDGVSLRTFNRNFLGRSGTKSAGVYLVSPETAVASALSGRITDPRVLGEKVCEGKMKISEAGFNVDDNNTNNPNTNNPDTNNSDTNNPNTNNSNANNPDTNNSNTNNSNTNNSNTNNSNTANNKIDNSNTSNNVDNTNTNNYNDSLMLQPEEDFVLREQIPIIMGPNIKPLPVNCSLPATFSGKVILKTGDNITTDHIMPAGAKILPLRSNIPAISEYVFSSLDPDFVKRAKENKCSFIVGGENYGQGSSREHAALAPMYLGIKAVIAKSFARIHKTNLINFGILPLTFANIEDYDKFSQDDNLIFENILENIKSSLTDSNNKFINVKNATKNINLKLRHDLNCRQAQMILAGGLLNFIKNNKLGNNELDNNKLSNNKLDNNNNNNDQLDNHRLSNNKSDNNKSNYNKSDYEGYKMEFEKLYFPSEEEKITITGERITITDNKLNVSDHPKLNVPDHPIIGLIRGDGTGEDISRAGKKVLDAAVDLAYDGQKKISWLRLYAGDDALERCDQLLPSDTIQAIEKYLVAIKGPLTTPVGKGTKSLNVQLRQILDLYACVRPVNYFAGVPNPMKNPEKLDVVIFRENTEDVYAGIEWKQGSEEVHKVIDFLNSQMGCQIREDSGLGVKPISIFGTKRLVKTAIEYALKNKRRSVTLVHKGNIMKFTEGSFKEWGYEVAKEYPQLITEEELTERYGGNCPADKIVINDRIADSMFQQLLLRPDEYDVIATPNLNGDYLSDACAAQVGGLGLAPGANINYDTGCAIFEATHGSAPKYAGMDKVNPSSFILSGVMMLEYLGWQEAADLIVKAIKKTIIDKTVTYDLHRQIDDATLLKCSEFAEAIISNMHRV